MLALQLAQALQTQTLMPVSMLVLIPLQVHTSLQVLNLPEILLPESDTQQEISQALVPLRALVVQPHLLLMPELQVQQAAISANKLPVPPAIPQAET